MSFYGNLNRDDEVKYLREAMERAVSSDASTGWPPDDVLAAHQMKLDLLTSLDNPSRSQKEYLNVYPVFTATLDYFATGEGRTLMFIARRAHTMADFLVYLCGEISGYYAIGVDLFHGLPPETNGIAKALLGPGVRATLKKEIEAEERGGGGHVEVFLHQHINYS